MSEEYERLMRKIKAAAKRSRIGFAVSAPNANVVPMFVRPRPMPVFHRGPHSWRPSASDDLIPFPGSGVMNCKYWASIEWVPVEPKSALELLGEICNE